MRRNQKGFTLVELIVTVVIMSIVITVSLVSFSLVVGQNIKGCTSDLQGYIAKTRVESLSRAEARMTISSTGYGVYVNLSLKDGSGSWIGRDDKIGRPAIDITYKTDDGTGNDYTVSDANKLVLSFDRSSGAFKPLPATVAGSDGTNYCTEILLKQGDRTRKIIMYPQTGKYDVESM